jgi:PKD repeat protein
MGEYEIDGYSDEADVPNYGPLPTPIPAIQMLDFPLGNRTYEVGAFTNASQVTSALDAPRKTLNLNITSEADASVFADLILQQNFLQRPFNVTIDGTLVNATEADTNSTAYLYLALSGGSHTVSILGTSLVDVPEAIVYYPTSANVGQTITFNASQSQDVGRIVSYQWDFGDGTNETGSVVMHSYHREGTYTVQLNLTNNQGMNGLSTFTIVVSNPINWLLFLKIGVVIMVIAIVSIFAILLRNRRKTDAETKQTQE